MKLILPFPPSVNTYWRHPNKGAFAGKSLISEAGRKFQSAACAAIVEQLRRLPKPTSAPASVEIVLFPPDKWRTSMNLEALPKYYSPKSPKLSDEAPATGSSGLTITDVMAAQGMVQSKAPLGFALFLAKVGVQDPQFAIEGLLNYAMALDNPTLNKLSEETRLQIIPYLVNFAFADYSRSAASKARCEHCAGTGFHNVLREVVKHSRSGESVIKEEWVKELCQHCHGKGEVSTACRGCKGKGIVLDEKRTRLHGVPVYKICGRCNGNRFSRLPTTLARHHVQKLVPDLTDYQWYKGYADVIDKLVTKCWQEEAYAEAQLRKVTR